MQQIYNEQTFSCGLCKKTFKKEGFLLRHFFNHSAGVKLLACKKYAYSIVESCLLKKHNFLVRKRRKQERLALKLQKAESLITDRHEFVFHTSIKNWFNNRLIKHVCVGIVLKREGVGFMNYEQFYFVWFSLSFRNNLPSENLFEWISFYPN